MNEVSTDPLKNYETMANDQLAEDEAKYSKRLAVQDGEIVYERD